MKANHYLINNLNLRENDDLFEYLSSNFKNFNFGSYIDYLAEEIPDNLAMKHVDLDGVERNFTFKDMSVLSNKAANYFTSIGIKKGDRVMLVLKNTYQFYIVMLALEKIGAIAMPTHFMTKDSEYKYRMDKAKVNAVIATDYGIILDEINKAIGDSEIIKVVVNKTSEKENGDYLDFDAGMETMASTYKVEKNNINDPMVIYNTSGTTGHAKLVVQDYGFPLAHITTGKDWYGVDENSLHYTVADSGWAMSSWNMFAVWMNKGAIFIHDYDRFKAEELLQSFDKYNITSICAPRVMWRMMLESGMENYNFSSLRAISSAGEHIDKSTYDAVLKYTGKKIREGYGQTEIVLPAYDNSDSSATVCNSLYSKVKVDKPIDGVGEITVVSDKKYKFGILLGYLIGVEATGKLNLTNLPKQGRKVVWRTGDAGSMVDGKLRCYGRMNDMIKTSDCLVYPLEIENVLMQLEYIKECVVYGIDDEVAGTVLKAQIVLNEGYESTEELKKQISDYVKSKVEDYKRPKIIEFCEELEKTNNGKIKRKRRKS